MLTLLAIAISFQLAQPASQPATQPSVSPQAEVRMLRQACNRQVEEIAKLKVEVERLKDLLRDAGVEVTTEPAKVSASTTQPKGPVKRTVYVLDTSGSMINRIGFAKQQILRSIGSPGEERFFNIIAFQDAKPKTLYQLLHHANTVSLHEAEEFLGQVTTAGSTDPSEALQLALSMRASDIWFITDGDFPDESKALRAAEAAKAQRVRIHTIAKFGRETSWTLYEMSKQTGGKAIDEDGKPAPEPRAHHVSQSPNSPQPPTPGKSIFDE